MTAYHLSATPKTKKQVQEAQLQIAQNVLVWTNELCKALNNDYIHTSVESYKRKLHSASSGGRLTTTLTASKKSRRILTMISCVSLVESTTRS